MGTLANAFTLLADQQGNEPSTIIALKCSELKKIAWENKKIAEEKKKAEAKKKKKKKSSARDGGGQGNAVEQRYDSRASDRDVYMSYWKAKGNTGDGQANQEKVSFRTVIESRERWLAREEERKKDMALKTLKEYEEQKAYEKKHKAYEKATLSVPET